MFEALVEGLGLIFQWHVLAYFALGCVIGILMGAIPGMGGAIGLVLLMPFTFSMEPVAAFALLLSSWASTSTSGAITSVLLGVPSTAASQATVLDGYPMAKRGEAARALGASFTASAGLLTSLWLSLTDLGACQSQIRKLRLATALFSSTVLIRMTSPMWGLFALAVGTVISAVRDVLRGR